MSLVVRTRHDPLALVGAIRSELRRQDPSLALGEVRPMLDVVGRPLARQRLESLLLVGFGGAALALAALGLYGLLAYSVAARAHAFAVRHALGARSDQLFAAVLQRGMKLVLIGVGAGLALLPSATGALRRVFAIGAVSSILVLLIGGLLCVVGMCACVIPGFQASATRDQWNAARLTSGRSTWLWLRCGSQDPRGEPHKTSLRRCATRSSQGRMTAC